MTCIRLTTGEKIWLTLEQGAAINELIDNGAQFITLSTHGNRRISVYDIRDINPTYPPRLVQWGAPLETPSHLLPGGNDHRASTDSEGYLKFQAMKKRLQNRQPK